MIRQTFLLLLFFPALPSVHAGGNPPTKGADAGSIAFYERLALVSNPTLRQAEAIVEGELAKAEQAGLYPNPTVGYMGEQIGATHEQYLESPGEFQGGFVQQRFVVPAKLDLSKKKYLARAEVSGFDREAQILSVRNDVRIHAYRVIGRQEHLAVQRELLESFRDGVLTAGELFNVGQANEVDVAMARIALTEQELTVQMAENQLSAAWKELEAVVGAPVQKRALKDSLMGSVPDADWDATLQKLLMNSPAVQAADAKLRADNITLARERVEPIPDLTVQGAYGHNFDVGIQENVFNVSASIELPIFDRNQGTVRQAQADLARQQSEILRVQRELMQRLAPVFMQFETMRQRILAYQKSILPEAKEAYETSLKSYQANRLAWPPVLETQRFYFNKRLLQIDQWVALREAQTLIDGYLLTSALMPPPGPVPAGHIDSNPRPR